MAEVEQHGDWLIWHDPLPIEWRGADWHYARVDARDTSLDIGNEESREMCLQTIDYMEEQEREDATPEGQARIERFVDRGMQTMAAFLLARAVKNLLNLPGIGNLPGFATGTHIEAARWALTNFNERHGLASVDERSQSQDPEEGLGPQAASAVTPKAADAQTVQSS